MHKLGVQFGETIGLKNMVEKWVENLAEKIGGIIGLRNLVGKAYSVRCTVYSKVVLLSNVFLFALQVIFDLLC